MNLTAEKIFQYLREHAGLDPAGVTEESALFTSSLLDSVSLVDLIVFIEKEMGVKIEPDDVVIDHFDSVAAILRFAQSKGAA